MEKDEFTLMWKCERNDLAYVTTKLLAFCTKLRFSTSWKAEDFSRFVSFHWDIADRKQDGIISFTEIAIFHQLLKQYKSQKVVLGKLFGTFDPGRSDATLLLNLSKKLVYKVLKPSDVAFAQGTSIFEFKFQR
jgi:hypothetical protein